ncbi:AAA family ATPase [Frigidibacter sp. MR17.14]|uniref:AAA family ATPase n=1 Tax=Frigidibacter sp. MR17.14 TaxID=3126509 RepID=UPI0030130B33
MTRIPFVTSRFPDPRYNEFALRNRFRGFAVQLEARKNPQPQATDPNGKPASVSLHDIVDKPSVPYEVGVRINRRSKCLAAQHVAAGPIAQLKDDDRELIERVRDGVALVRIESEDHADRVAAAVHEEFPWLAPATVALWHAMRRSVRNSDRGFRLPPLVLDGPPGIGKSAWARYVAEQLRVPTIAIDASGDGAGWGIIGLQKGWGSAMPGRPLTTIIEHQIGNPCVIIDEVEKPGVDRNAKGESYSLTSALLPLLEPLGARAWNCPYFRVPLDMSWISWIMTSNDQRRLPAPLRSRCTILSLRQLTLPELMDFVRRQQDRRGLSDDAIAAVVAALETAPGLTTSPSLRTAIRLLSLAEDQDNRPRFH